MGASRRFRRRVRRRRFAGSPAELSMNGRILTPAERAESLALAQVSADDAVDAGCSCDYVDVLVLEGAAGAIFTPGRLTQVAVAHEDGCPLADGDLHDAMSRLAMVDSIFNEGKDSL